MDDNTPTKIVQQPKLIQVVQGMRDFALKGKSDLVVRQLAEDIVAQIIDGDYAGECLALYYWVCQNIRYVRDIDNVEFVKEPRQVIATRTGDCDDMATLLAALLMSIGNRCNFVLASFDNSGMPSHVFVEVVTPSGTRALDPVANRASAEMLSRIVSKKIVPVE